MTSLISLILLKYQTLKLTFNYITEFINKSLLNITLLNV